MLSTSTHTRLGETSRGRLPPNNTPPNNNRNSKHSQALSEAEESTRVPTSTPDPRNQKHHVTPSRAYPTHTIIPGPPYASLTCRFNLTRRSDGPYHPCGAY